MAIMNASWITLLAISFTLFFTSVYWFYLFPEQKAKKAALLTAILASIASTCVFFSVVDILAPFGGLLILSCWALPSLLLWEFRASFVGLDQRKLIGLQIFRLIGGCFLIEMQRGLIPASFALPAGIGDILVGLVAAGIFFCYPRTPRGAVILVTALGLLDFASAFFFGFTSLPGPAQLFAVGAVNQVNLYPTGMIPLFLVPYAIFNHLLSIINLKTSNRMPS